MSGLAFLELEVVDVRLRATLICSSLDDFLIRLLNERLERLRRMASPKRFRTIAAGALPGRKPGMFTFDASLRAASFLAASTSSTGMVTWIRRSAPSLFFDSIAMFMGSQQASANRRGPMAGRGGTSQRRKLMGAETGSKSAIRRELPSTGSPNP